MFTRAELSLRTNMHETKLQPSVQPSRLDFALRAELFKIIVAVDPVGVGFRIYVLFVRALIGSMSSWVHRVVRSRCAASDDDRLTTISDQPDKTGDSG